MVAHTGGGTAGDHHHIGLVQRGQHRAAQGLGVVAHQTGQRRLGTGTAAKGGKAVGIDVPHLAGAGLAPDGHHLVTGGDDGHPGRTAYGHVLLSEGGQQTDLLRAQLAARGDDAVTGGGVLVTHDHMVTGGLGAGELHHVAAGRAGIFHHDHAIRALGQHAARKDARALAGLEADVRHGAHGAVAHAFQQGGGTFLRAEDITGAHGESVHGGTVKTGQVGRGVQGFRQAAAQGIRQGDGLRGQDGQGAQMPQHGLHGLQGQKVLHGFSLCTGVTGRTAEKHTAMPAGCKAFASCGTVERKGRLRAVRPSLWGKGGCRGIATGGRRRGAAGHPGSGGGKRPDA